MQKKPVVLRVAALVNETVRRLALDTDLDELLVAGVVLAEVGAHPALTFVKLDHGFIVRWRVPPAQ